MGIGELLWNANIKNLFMVSWTDSGRIHFFWTNIVRTTEPSIIVGFWSRPPKIQWIITSEFFAPIFRNVRRKITLNQILFYGRTYTKYKRNEGEEDHTIRRCRLSFQTIKTAIEKVGYSFQTFRTFKSRESFIISSFIHAFHLILSFLKNKFILFNNEKLYLSFQITQKSLKSIKIKKEIIVS